MRIIFFILICVSAFACSTPQYKRCEFQTDDKELKLYHDVLTELIEHHFYNGYLRQVGEELEEKYPASLDFSDTAAFNRDVILAQNSLFNDTAKFETICYRPTPDGPWSDFHRDFSERAKTDTTKHIGEIKAFLSSFSSSWETVADTIGKPQTNYTAADFELCTAKVVSGSHFYDADIGVVSFSRAFMSRDKTKGLLYYEFLCGGKCGKGEIIMVELIRGHWRIRKVHQLWIS